jgi:hypothetical protein
MFTTDTRALIIVRNREYFQKERFLICGGTNLFQRRTLKMRTCRLAKSMLICVIVSLVLAAPAYAVDGALNLPSTMVRIEVSDGIHSYFDTMLSEVPSGYDVTNGTYHGWCVDVRTEMARTPATHPVFLYSSTSAPGELANGAWNLINYILNHKQGSVQDIQQAIWYFASMDSDYAPTSPTAWKIINDTLENGNGFVPSQGEIVAVICYPTILFPNQPDVQISIIEVQDIGATVIPEFPSALALLPIMLTVLLAGLVCTKKLKIHR